MATDQSMADFIVDQLSSLGNVRARKMFGEYGLFYRDKMVALICDGQLFVKITDAGRKLLGEHETGLPYTTAKPCFLISETELEARDAVLELIRRTYDELPAPKKKQPRGIS